MKFDALNILNKSKSNTQNERFEGNISFRIIGVGRALKTIFADNEFDIDFQKYGLWRSKLAVKYEIVNEYKLYDLTNADVKKIPEFLPIAFPSNPLIHIPPVENEFVILFSGPSIELNDGKNYTIVYYTGPLNIWNSNNHNSFPDMNNYSTKVKEDHNIGSNKNVVSEDKKENFNPPDLYGKDFQESSPSYPIILNGEVMYSGRHGQYIKFGHSTLRRRAFNLYSDNFGDESVKETDPITIICNQMRENPDKFNPIADDINQDGAAIWMTSTQRIPLDLDEYKLLSFGINDTTTNAIVST